MEDHILIVDDEINVRSSLQDYFEREGFKVSVAEDGNQALTMLKRTKPKLIILDVQLPLVNGLEICRRAREEHGQHVGIIMISGVKKELVDRVVGLEIGADVYMTKPFETRELLAQTRALLRRMKTIQRRGEESGWFVVDEDLRIHFEKRLVEVRGEEVNLTRLEFDLLKFLAERPGIPRGRSDIIDAVWGYEAGGDVMDGAVNTCVAKLRSKIEPDTANPRYIHSVHGIGYRFKEL